MMSLDGKMIEKTFLVRTHLGLHARVATMLVQAMQNYSCRVTLIKDGVEVSARSVLGLLLLAAEPGSKVIVRAEGPDSLQAIDTIGRLMENEEPESH